MKLSRLSGIWRILFLRVTYPSNILSTDPEPVELSSVKIPIFFVLKFNLLALSIVANHFEKDIGVCAGIFIGRRLEFYVIFRVW